jgi:putative tryptophan/tyrosine transport system substrate-binding protein
LAQRSNTQQRLVFRFQRTARDLPDLYRRAAPYVDKILKGEKPGDLPLQLAEKYELVINLNTAQGLGLTISESFLLLADEVIE